MHKYLIVLAIILASSHSQADSLINDERILNEKTCFSWVFSGYDSWRSSMEEKYRKKIKSEEKIKSAMTRFDTLFTEESFNLYKNKLSCSTFQYPVDGNIVKGYIIRPKVIEKTLPVLIYNRGGNGNFGGVVFGAMMLNLFPVANENFIIIGSQYRGTFTRPPTAQDEFGGKDINDVTELLSYIPNIVGADPARIGMYGASRGGMQTFMALRQTNNIKAVATIAGNSDLMAGLNERPEMEKVYKKRIPNYVKNKDTELAKRSVITWVDELSPKVPVLLIHGTNDKRVSVNHSINLASALSEHNIPHKLVLYPEDNHGLRKNRASAHKEVVTWFNLHL